MVVQLNLKLNAMWKAVGSDWHGTSMHFCVLSPIFTEVHLTTFQHARVWLLWIGQQWYWFKGRCRRWNIWVASTSFRWIWCTILFINVTCPMPQHQTRLCCSAPKVIGQSKWTKAVSYTSLLHSKWSNLSAPSQAKEGREMGNWWTLKLLCNHYLWQWQPLVELS